MTTHLSPRQAVSARTGPACELSPDAAAALAAVIAGEALGLPEADAVALIAARLRALHMEGVIAGNDAALAIIDNLFPLRRGLA